MKRPRRWYYIKVWRGVVATLGMEAFQLFTIAFEVLDLRGRWGSRAQMESVLHAGQFRKGAQVCHDGTIRSLRVSS